MGKFVDLSGMDFGRLNVLERSGTSSNKRVMYKCVCSCGKETIVATNHLKNGHTKSCGCLSLEKRKEAVQKHCMTGTRLYIKWKNMNQRCTNVKLKQYKDYGGRGIDVSEKWRNDFVAFYEWSILNGWKDGLEIDRIDNDKGYSESNCRFVEKKNNALNKRSHKGSTSKYKGVSWNANVGKWSCQIQKDGINLHIGYFKDEAKAAEAYNAKAKELFGEYAYLNK